jgi:hypothetical protein
MIQVSLAIVVFISIAWTVWTGHRMISIGEFASDHATSGYPGAGTWLGFLGAVIVGLASLATLIVLTSQGRRRY